MKEDYLLDQEILKIAIEYISSEIKQGDFAIFSVKNGSCNAC
jgi:hypothetical protein